MLVQLWIHSRKSPDWQDADYTSTTGEIYIDNSKYTSEVGDTMETKEGELFEVDTVNDDGIISAVFNNKKISAGGNHSMIILPGDLVYVTGDNTHGQLGDNTTTLRFAFTQPAGNPTALCVSAGTSHSMIIKLDGTVYSTGLNTSGQLGTNNNTEYHIYTATTLGTNAVALSTGDNQLCFY